MNFDFDLSADKLNSVIKEIIRKDYFDREYPIYDYRTAAIKKYVYGKDKDKVIDNAVRIAEQKYLNGELKIPTKLT